MLQEWSFWRVEFSIHVWSLYALMLCIPSRELPDTTTNRLCGHWCSWVLSTLILAVQPYKKIYMNVIDGLLLALLGVLSLLLITLEYLLPSASETLPLIILIACGLPQLVLVLSVTCRQLKGKQMAQYIAGKVSTLLKQIRKWKQGNELSDADSWPHSVVSPNQYNRSLLPDTGQTHNNSETLTVRGQVPPVNNYGSVN